MESKSYTKKFFKEFHKLMKSGRLNKIVKHSLENEKHNKKDRRIRERVA